MTRRGVPSALVKAVVAALLAVVLLFTSSTLIGDGSRRPSGVLTSSSASFVLNKKALEGFRRQCVASHDVGLLLHPPGPGIPSTSTTTGVHGLRVASATGPAVFVNSLAYGYHWLLLLGKNEEEEKEEAGGRVNGSTAAMKAPRNKYRCMINESKEVTMPFGSVGGFGDAPADGDFMSFATIDVCDAIKTQSSTREQGLEAVTVKWREEYFYLRLNGADGVSYLQQMTGARAASVEGLGGHDGRSSPSTRPLKQSKKSKRVNALVHPGMHFPGHTLEQLSFLFGKLLAMFPRELLEEEDLSMLAADPSTISEELELGHVLVPDGNPFFPMWMELVGRAFPRLRAIKREIGNASTLNIFFFTPEKSTASTRLEPGDDDDDDASLLLLYPAKMVLDEPCQYFFFTLLHNALLSSRRQQQREEEEEVVAVKNRLPIASSPSILSSTPQRRIIIIKQYNATLPHFTHRSFRVSPATHDILTRELGFVFIPEDVCKVDRYWLLKEAEVVIDSSGANMEINTLLMHHPLAPGTRLRHRITLIHPEAEDFVRHVCNRSATLLHHPQKNFSTIRYTTSGSSLPEHLYTRAGKGGVRVGGGGDLVDHLGRHDIICPSTASLDGIDFTPLLQQPQ